MKRADLMEAFRRLPWSAQTLDALLNHMTLPQLIKAAGWEIFVQDIPNESHVRLIREAARMLNGDGWLTFEDDPIER